MMQQSVNLRRRFLRVIALCFALFLAAEGALIIWYNNYRTQEARNYLESALQNTEAKLAEMDARLRMIGSYLTVHPALAMAGKLKASVNVSNEVMQSAFDVMRMTVSASSEVEDVVLVNRAGKSRSYVSGVGVALINLLTDEYNFASEEAENARYFFFPAQHFDHDPLFAFVIPLWDMRYGENKVEYASLERVGSIVLACRVSAIIALMDYGLERPYTCQVLSADGALITENKSALRRADDVLMRPIDDLGVALRISMEETQYFDSGFFLPAVLCTGLFFLFTQLMFSRLISASILKPIRALTAEMPHIQTLSSRQRLTPLHVEELDVIVDSANHMLDELAEASDKAVRAKTELLETQMRRNEAELYALQSQINPHFLFNTMQCMRALAVMQGASDVATIATAMAALLRYSITDGDRVRLADEAAIVRKYLFIIDVRYQHKIACTIEIPQELMETECIRMMIQPLVENAVMHGVSQRECGGEIGIHAFRTAMDVVIEVRDNGCGIEPKRLEEINATLQLNFSDAVTHRQIQSFGLYNIHRRIQLAYGKGYGLSLCSVPGDTILQLRLPFTQEKRENVQ